MFPYEYRWKQRRTVAALIPSWLLYPLTLQVILALRQLGSDPLCIITWRLGKISDNGRYINVSYLNPDILMFK